MASEVTAQGYAALHAKLGRAQLEHPKRVYQFLGHKIHDETASNARLKFPNRFYHSRSSGPDFAVLDQPGLFVELTTTDRMVEEHKKKKGPYVDALFAQYVMPKPGT